MQLKKEFNDNCYIKSRCEKWKEKGERQLKKRNKQKERKFQRYVAYGNSQSCRLFHPTVSFFFYLSLQRAVTVPLYENAIPEIFYLLHHLHLLLLRIYGMPTFLSTMFLLRACTKEEDQSERRPPRRLRVLCPLSLFRSEHQCCFRSSSRTFQPTISCAVVCTRSPTISFFSFFPMKGRLHLIFPSKSNREKNYPKSIVCSIDLSVISKHVIRIFLVL